MERSRWGLRGRFSRMGKHKQKINGQEIARVNRKGAMIIEEPGAAD
jgi:hypothetical protein